MRTENIESFAKSKREELEKMIPMFVDDRKFTDIVLNFYERGIRDGAEWADRHNNVQISDHEIRSSREYIFANEACKYADMDPINAFEEGAEYGYQFALNGHTGTP